MRLQRHGTKRLTSTKRTNEHRTRNFENIHTEPTTKTKFKYYFFSVFFVHYFSRHCFNRLKTDVVLHRQFKTTARVQKMNYIIKIIIARRAHKRMTI